MISSLLLPLLGSRKTCDNQLSINKITKTTAPGFINTQNRSNNDWRIEVINNSKNIVMSHKFLQTLIKIASICCISQDDWSKKKHCSTLHHTHQQIAAQGDCTYQVHWPSHSWKYYYNICTHTHQYQRQCHPWSVITECVLSCTSIELGQSAANMFHAQKQYINNGLLLYLVTNIGQLII